MYNVDTSNATIFWIGTAFFTWVTFYAYFSFLRVYNQGWVKTLFKFTLVGYVYFTALLFLLAFELYTSILLF